MNKRLARKKRIRKKIFGVKNKPRISVFRSNKHIYAQAIDDESGTTLVSSCDIKLPKIGKKTTKLTKAYEVGLELSKKLKELKIEKAVFDRSGYKFHGRVKKIAQGLRDGGIKV